MILFRLRKAHFQCNVRELLQNAPFLLLILFLLVFPKGGVKFGGVPLTWGYLALFLFSFCYLIIKPIRFSRPRFFALLTVAPFIFISLSSMLINGIDTYSFASSFFVSFVLLPFFFFAVFSTHIDRIDFPRFQFLFKKCIFFISCFGLFLFVLKLFTGKYLLIPYLTVPMADIESFDVDKCIDRGGIFKLISTYNNGNIYGICMCMVMPFYLLIEDKKMRKSLFLISLLLTLSRTVWIGAIIGVTLYFLFTHKITLRSILKFLTCIFIFILCIKICSELINATQSFLMDPTFGNRIDQFSILDRWEVISLLSFQGVAEVVYLSMLENFGLIGLLAFLVAMVGSLAIYQFYVLPLHKFSAEDQTVRRSILSGLVVYLVLCCSDGAILYIPTLVFFWFLSSLLLSQRELFQIYE